MSWAEVRGLASAQVALGCVWGRTVHTPDDDAMCTRQAVQIVVVHDGDVSVHLKLCGRHVERLSWETTPREPALDHEHVGHGP